MSSALILELYRFSFDSVPFAYADCLAMPCPFKADKTHGPPDIFRLDKMYNNSAASVMNGKTNMNKYKPREFPSFALISIYHHLSVYILWNLKIPRLGLPAQVPRFRLSQGCDYDLLVQCGALPLRTLLWNKLGVLNRGPLTTSYNILQHLTTSYNILQGGKALFLGGCIFIFSRLPGNSRKIWYSQRFNASAILTESNRISHFWVASNIRCDERVEGHASSICSEGRLLRDSEGIRNKYSRQPIISHTEWMRAAHAVKLDGQTILMGMWQRIVRMTAFRRYKIYLNLTLTKCWTVLKVTY